MVENGNLEYNTISGDTEIVRSTDDNTAFPTLNLKRSRNNAASPGSVHSGDLLGKITFDGHDGNSYENAAQIRVHLENSGTPVANNNMGGKMSLATTASAASSLTDRVTIDMAGQVQVQAATEATDPDTGSVRVMGGLSAAGPVYAGGNFVATCTDAANDGISDVLILGKSTSGTAAAGIGPGVSVGIENAAGTLKEAATIEFTLVAAGDGAESAGIDMKLITGGSLSAGWSGSADGIAVGSITDSTSSTTGSGKLTGGMGVAKRVYTGGIMMVSFGEDSLTEVKGAVVTAGGMGVAKRVYSGSATVALGTDEAESAVTGTLLAKGGLGVAKRIYSGGEVAILIATPSTSNTDCGAACVVGGVGVALNLYAGAAIVAEGATASTTHQSGSLLTKGGLGVAGRLYSAGKTVILDATVADDKISGSIVTAGGMAAALSVYSGGQVRDVGCCC